MISNLKIHCVEFRSEEDEDVAPYCHPRIVEERVVSLAAEVRPIQDMIKQLLADRLGKLHSKQVGPYCPTPHAVAITFGKCRIHKKCCSVLFLMCAAVSTNYAEASLLLSKDTSRLDRVGCSQPAAMPSLLHGSKPKVP